MPARCSAVQLVLRVISCFASLSASAAGPSVMPQPASLVVVTLMGQSTQSQSVSDWCSQENLFHAKKRGLTFSRL